MATIAANLLNISGSKDDLADNLVTMGVTANNTESLASLVGKVLDIEGGTDTSDATATAADILDGETAYGSAGTKLTGTMTNVGAQTATISTVAGTVTPTVGYHNGSGSVSIHADEQAKLITGNIKSGITVLGVSGDANVVNTSSGTAVAADLTYGVKAWVDGAEVTGTRGVDEYTVVLLHMDGENNGTTFTDVMGKTWTPTGTAVTSTAQKAYGSASGYFDGNSDYLETPDHADFNFADGPFTIDCWIRPSGSATRVIFAQYDDASNVLTFYASANGLYFVSLSGGTAMCNYSNTTCLPTMDIWYHVAAVRNGTDFYIFVNGAPVSLTATTPISTNSLPNLTSAPKIGVRKHTGVEDRWFNGYIDEFRISKGIARWTAAFAPGNPYG